MASRIVRAVGWLGAFGAVSAAALHFLDVSWLPLIAATSLVPFGVVAAVAAVVCMVIARGRVGLVVGAAALLASASLQAPLFLRDAPKLTSGPKLTVMQANLLFDGARADEIIAAVRDNNVEVLTVNELTRATAAALSEAGIERLLPYRFLAPGQTASGTGIWSRYPLSDDVEYDGYVLNQLSATLAHPTAGALKVFALHPVPPVYDAHMWRDELRRLAQVVHAAPAAHPTIVGGDVNATNDHRAFREFLYDGMRDATDEAGAGLVFTYPTDKWYPPIIGLDHILVRGARASHVRSVSIAGSDHRALVAEIDLPSNAT